MADIVLQEDQKLIEHWTVEFTGRNRLRRKPEEWIECRVVKMYHGTVYGGANGTGKTVEEARLNAVLGLARAICDDSTAFQHDADEIMKGEQYRWWKGKLHDLHEALEFTEGEDDPGDKKLRRRMKLTEQLMAEWQEEHDYWPEQDKTVRPDGSPGFDPDDRELMGKA